MYELQKAHKDIVDKIVGKQPLDKNDGIFFPLINGLENHFSPIVKSLTNQLGNYEAKYIQDISLTLPIEGDWISYQNASPSKVNYGKANFLKSFKTEKQGEPKNQLEKNNIKSPKGNTGKLEKNDTKNSEDETRIATERFERYVFDAILTDIISKSVDAKISNYNAYSNLIWGVLFPIEKNKYLDIGKIFIGSENSLAVFPYHAKPFKLDVTTRDWWNAAYYVDNNERKRRDYYDLTSDSTNAGITHIYSDIVSDQGLTDLNRTAWFKFESFGKKFVLGVDLRLSEFSLNIFKEIRFEIISLIALCSLLPFLVYASKSQAASADSIERIYKILRVGRQKVTYNAGQPKMSEFSST